MPDGRRPLLRWFSLRCALGLALLLAAWPVLAGPYGDWFRTVGEASAWATGFAEVDFVARRPGDPEPKDTVIVVPERGSVPGWTLRCDSRFTGYLPTIVFVALLLATPLPWRRRRRAVLSGLVLVHGYIVVRLALGLLVGLSRNAKLAPTGAMPDFLLHPLWLRSLQITSAIVDREPTIYVGIPVVIWIVATFRATDREPLLGLGRAREGASGTAGSSRRLLWG